MRKRISAVFPASILLFALFLISCSGGGNPVVPDNNSASGLDESSIAVENFSKGIPDASEQDPVIHSILNDSENYAPGEVLVALKDGIIPTDENGMIQSGAVSQAVSYMAGHGLGMIEVIHLGWGTVYRLGIHDGKSVMDKVAELRALPEVEIAEPNYKVYFCEAPYFPNDYFWENPNDDDEDPRSTVFEQFGPSKIGASVCWNENNGLEDVVVCILDTGVQWWHEDLQNNMWHNPGEIPDNGLDDDENGFIDDIYGWDTDEEDADITEYSSYHSYHGTACSGVVAATQDNTVGCSGIAPGVRIMGVKCDLGGGSGYTSSVIEGIDYAKNNGADIVSMSFRTYSDSEAMHATMDDAWAAGVILIGAAGNEDSTDLTYPASWSCVMEVGGTSAFTEAYEYAPHDEMRISHANGFSWGSNWGSHLEIMGFGVHYITTYGAHYSAYWDGQNDFFFGGTSNATPMVAGAMALLKSYYPDETNEWLRQRLRETADDLYEPGFDVNSGNGRIDCIRACYGPDRFADEEDPMGFVDMAPYDGELYDSLHNFPGNPYLDTEDLYKFTATETGYLLFDLDIYTWGEDLDLEIYSDPSLDPQYLLDSRTGENHAGSSREIGGIACEAGQTYYIRVFTAGAGDSTAYGLSVRSAENTIQIQDNSDYDPGQINNECTNVPVGYIDFDTSFRVHLSELIVSLNGTMPASNVSGLHLYRDSNGNGVYNTGDEHLADATIGATNRFVFENTDIEINFEDCPERIFLTVDLEGITGDGQFELVLSSYKDISTSEGLEVPYADFPIEFGPFNVGYDPDPPTWDTTVGIQTAESRWKAALVGWNSATDTQSPPARFNVYWTQTLPFDFGSADCERDVGFWNGSSTDHAWLLSGLENDETYFVAVRAEDQAGNEETNILYQEVIPGATGDPTDPQLIGSVDTPGSAWEVVVDPAHERVFVADYDGGVLTIDVSIPASPEIVDTVPASNVRGVDFDGTYVYAAGASGLLVIDPDAVGGAEIIGTASAPSALDVCVVGSWVYVTDNGTNLYSVDVSDPYAPVRYDPVTSGAYGYGMDAQDGYLYVACYYQPRVFDLSDPSAPVFLNTFGGNGAYEIDAVGDRCYVTYWSGSRFSIYSLTDPTAPEFVGYWQSNSGSYGADIVWVNSHIYFGTNEHYVEVVNVDDWEAPYEVGQVSTDGPDGMDTDGLFIYTAENEAGLKVIL